MVPDIISQLSDPECDTSPTTFRAVVGYVHSIVLYVHNYLRLMLVVLFVRHLFKLVKKEKQQESLIEKLCHRIRAVRYVCVWVGGCVRVCVYVCCGCICVYVCIKGE